MNTDLACVIYTDLNEHELKEKLRHLFPEWKDDGETYILRNEIDIVRNLDFDSVKRRHFPDGFLYFHNRIEVFPGEHEPGSLENQIELVSKILKYLWSQGIPAVATCDYEDQLPNNGGYKSTDVPPWVSGVRPYN